MKHPFKALEPEYIHRLQVLKVTRASAAHKVATRLCQDSYLAHYRSVYEKLGIPMIWTAASFERESSSDFHTNPAQAP